MTARARVPRSRVSQDRWLVSYADFITLLFAFFVVLYAFSKASQIKQSQVSQAIDTAFHSLAMLPEGKQVDTSRASSSGPDSRASAVMKESPVSPAKVKDDLEHMRRELEMALDTQIAAGAVGLRMDRDGLVISLREAGFFDSGSADPRRESLPTLRQIASSLSRTPYDLRVEGHTDDVPIHTTEFDSNWELSSTRAARVARILLALEAVPADHLSAAGYAEFHPLASNATAEGRSQNRRVDLVVMPRTSLDFSATANQTTGGSWRKITDN